MNKQQATEFQQRLTTMRTGLLAQIAEQRGGVVSRPDPAALARIEKGSYGECTDCDARITAARLHATPEAPRCIHCQEIHEKANGH